MIAVEDLVNIPEFEAAARAKLNAETYALVADGARGMFDRITLRPRMMVDTRKLDLTCPLFGQQMFAPVLVAAVPGQQRFYPEGQLATARGTAGAKAWMVIADEPGLALEPVIKAAGGNAWFQPVAHLGVDAGRLRALEAISAGCKVICLSDTGWDWSAIDRFRKGLSVPVVLKGVMSGEEGRLAVARGVQGVIVSNYAAGGAQGLASSIEVLPSVVSVVANKIPILIDGGFRRGNDVLAAVALGATAVMIGRPVLWGLASYGSAGVQRVIELLQTGLARDMAMCGKINLKALDASAISIHQRA